MDLIARDGAHPLSLERRFDLVGAVPASAVWLANHRSVQTRRKYKEAVAEFCQLFEIAGDADWPRVKLAHAIAYRESLVKAGMSERTINARLSALSSLFKHLVEQRVVTENPIRDIKRPKVQNATTKTPAITLRQAGDLINAPDPETLQGIRDRAILATMFYTGCRIGEVIKLKVKDFFEDGGYWVLDLKVKGGKENRVAIHHELQIALRRYLAEVGHGSEPETPLFLAVKRARRNDDRQPLTIMQLNRLFHKYARLVGLTDRIRPHSSRATFATEGLRGGASLEEMQVTLGHAWPRPPSRMTNNGSGTRRAPALGCIIDCAKSVALPLPSLQLKYP